MVSTWSVCLNENDYQPCAGFLNVIKKQKAWLSDAFA